MDAVERLGALLPDEAAGELLRRADTLTGIRLRANRPVQLTGPGWDVLTEQTLDVPALQSLLSALMEHSVYARQDELDRGFFTLEDGSRVGVSGRMYREAGRTRLGEIGSACVRIARAVPGCADVLMHEIAPGDGLRSTLIVSPPGLGKTTLLRDAARQLSLAGRCVGIADERHELAACRRAVPTLDVGPRTDVMDGCARSEAISRMLRSMAPEVIVADEIGGREDALALEDAARCGVAVVASAHGGGLEDVRKRPWLRETLDSGAFGRVALLGPAPGGLRALWRWSGAGKEGPRWICA